MCTGQNLRQKSADEAFEPALVPPLIPEYGRTLRRISPDPGSIVRSLPAETRRNARPAARTACLRLKTHRATNPRPPRPARVHWTTHRATQFDGQAESASDTAAQARWSPVSRWSYALRRK